MQNIVAQASNNTLNLSSYCTWEKITLNANYIPTINDTAIYIVSTRNYDITKSEFVDYDYDTTGHLTYFIVYFTNNNWTAVPYSSLDKMLDKKKEKKDLVIFTEGLGKTFPGGIDRTTRLVRQYPIDAIFFDWPTLKPDISKGKNFRTTLKLSEKTARSYSSFIKEFEQYKFNHSENFKTVTIFFHSMGNLILMHALNQNLFANISGHFVDNLIVNAACVNQKHHKEWLEKWTLSNRIYITINNHDRNLNGAKVLLLKHQLGERPKRPFASNAKYIYFSNILEKEHNYFLMEPVLAKKPELKQFYSSVFDGTIKN